MSAATLSFGADCLLAQSYMTKIPVDGSWAKYTERHELDRDTDKAESWELEVTIRCVGTSYDEMETLRWIEIEFVDRSDTGRYQRKVYKMLIPEEHLGPGKDPVGNIRKMWYCHENRPGVLNPGELKPSDNYSLQSELRHFLTPPLKDKKRLPKKQVSIGESELDCSGTSGSLKMKYNEKGDSVGFYTISTYSNDSSPFGLVYSVTDIVCVSFRHKREGDVSYKSRVTRTLVESGKNAESVLPDCK